MVHGQAGLVPWSASRFDCLLGVAMELGPTGVHMLTESVRVVLEPVPTEAGLNPGLQGMSCYWRLSIQKSVRYWGNLCTLGQECNLNPWALAWYWSLSLWGWTICILCLGYAG